MHRKLTFDVICITNDDGNYIRRPGCKNFERQLALLLAPNVGQIVVTEKQQHEAMFESFFQFASIIGQASQAISGLNGLESKNAR